MIEKPGADWKVPQFCDFPIDLGVQHHGETQTLQNKYAATPAFCQSHTCAAFCATAHMLGSDTPSALNPKLTLKP